MTATTASGRHPAGPPGDERLVRSNWLVRSLRRPALGSLIGVIVIFVLFSAFDATPNHLWLSQTGVAAWSQQAAFFGIMSVPVALLMIGGEFDLSTGVMTGSTAILMALFVGDMGLNAWVAVILTVIFAVIVGLVNGLVVVKTKLNSFIVTLATFFILRGLSVGGVLLISHGSSEISVSRANPSGMGSLKFLFGSSFGHNASVHSGYQTAILWFIAVTIVATWVLGRTTFGNWIFAVGGDASAARNVGVPVDRTKIILFVSCSVAAALVGIISFAQASSAVSEQGVGYEFYYIIAAVVGGCLLNGGYGSAIGGALGAVVIGMAFEGVIYAGWNSSWDFAFLGLVLFLAVGVNTFIYKRAMKAKH